MENSWMHIVIVANLTLCWLLAAQAVVEITTRREVARSADSESEPETELWKDTYGG
jgi:hypothetical protein